MFADAVTDTAISINSGATYTNSLTATVSTQPNHCPPGGDMDAFEVALSNDNSTFTIVKAAGLAWPAGNCVSGVPPATPATFNWSLATGADGVRTVYARFRHGNDVGSSSDTITYDATPPSLAITSPADGSSTSAAAFTVSGTVSDATSGVASVVVNGITATLSGTPTSGFSAADVPLDCGLNTITATATDNATNQAQDSIDVTRTCGPDYTTNGFFRPVDMDGVLNKAKAGQTIPLKFDILADGVAVEDDTSLVGISVRSIDCTQTGTEADVIEEYSQSASGLRWDAAAQQYVFNFATQKSWAGTCKTVTLYLDGDEAAVAFFNFTK